MSNGFLPACLFPKRDSVKKSRYSPVGKGKMSIVPVMISRRQTILIFDEPTNHLDMESITALNNGMMKFPGVILFASHDHQIVQTTANRIMEILPNGVLIDKITTYDEYLASDEMARKRQVYTMTERQLSFPEAALWKQSSNAAVFFSFLSVFSSLCILLAKSQTLF